MFFKERKDEAFARKFMKCRFSYVFEPLNRLAIDQINSVAGQTSFCNVKTKYFLMCNGVKMCVLLSNMVIN